MLQNMFWKKKLRVFFRQTHILPWSHRAAFKTFVYLHGCWWKHGETLHFRRIPIPFQATHPWPGQTPPLHSAGRQRPRHSAPESGVADGASGFHGLGENPWKTLHFLGSKILEKCVFCKWSLNQVTGSGILDWCRGFWSYVLELTYHLRRPAVGKQSRESQMRIPSGELT